MRIRFELLACVKLIIEHSLASRLLRVFGYAVCSPGFHFAIFGGIQLSASGGKLALQFGHSGSGGLGCAGGGVSGFFEPGGVRLS